MTSAAGRTEELVQIDLGPRLSVRKPEWLKAQAPVGETFHALKKLARDLNLHTVCESAHCPNIGECWNQKAATFMMLGNLCTRRCGFCAVPKGRPEPIDLDEPRRVAFAVAQLGLAHAVVTSVNRDDDNLGAARAFVQVIREIRAQASGCRVEVLTPDFQGNDAALQLVAAARPDILNHNIETVPRLYRIAKSGGRYPRSLEFLRRAKELDPAQVTKTGIIVGLGEEMHELLTVFRDLADRRVDILTMGQYLRPSKDHLVMSRFYTPDEFAFLKHEALAMGFKHVESGPLVRSSYHAPRTSAVDRPRLMQPSEVKRVESALETEGKKELEWSLWYARLRQRVSSARPADIRYWGAVEAQVAAALAPAPETPAQPARAAKKKKVRGLGASDPNQAGLDNGTPENELLL